MVIYGYKFAYYEYKFGTKIETAAINVGKTTKTFAKNETLGSFYSRKV